MAIYSTGWMMKKNEDSFGIVNNRWFKEVVSD